MSSTWGHYNRYIYFMGVHAVDWSNDTQCTFLFQINEDTGTTRSVRRTVLDRTKPSAAEESKKYEAVRITPLHTHMR